MDESLESLACMECGYSLRGLTEAGRCPECGTSIAATVREANWRKSQPSLSHCNRRLLVQWAEGCGCNLVSFVLYAIAGCFFDPPRHSALRVFTLCILCCAWVTGGLGVWKIGCPEDPPDDGKGWWKHLTLLRGLQACYLAVPAAMFLHDWLPLEWDALWFLELPAILACPVIAALFHVRLRRIAELIPSQMLAIQASLLSFFVTGGILLLGCFATSFGGNGDQSSLSAMEMLPSPMFIAGWLPSAAIIATLRAGSGGVEGGVVIIVSAIVLGEVLVVVLILRQVLAALRGPSQEP